VTNSVFRDKVIIITGASSGIGQELAYQFAAQGAWLSLAARNADRLKTISASVKLVEESLLPFQRMSANKLSSQP